MKKISLLVLAILCCLMVGCGKKEVYEEVVFEELQTVADFLDIEVCEKKELVQWVFYYHPMEGLNDDEIKEYETYLTEEYGMTKDKENSSEEKRCYMLDDRQFTIGIKEENDDLLLYVRIPWSEERFAKNQKNAYEEMLTLLKEEEYEEAYDRTQMAGMEDYQDIEQYEEYCEGMICYKIKRAYGSAIEHLRKAGDVLNATEMLNEVLGKVSKYNGTYFADHPKYPGYGAGKYLSIRDGKVNYEFEDTYKKSTELSYMEEIYEKDTGNGKTMLLTGFSIGNVKFEVDEEKYDYGMIESGNNLIIIRYETNEYDTWNGTYIKINDSALPEKAD